MKNYEVIGVSVPPDEYNKIINKAFRYALISVGFTYNRLEKKDITSRIENIIKGKIAEGLIEAFSNRHQLKLDFQSCATPFWMPDLRDFLWLGGEWDIKNNFVYCSDAEIQNLDFTLLPALIPNKSDPDQWSKRNELLHHESRYNAYLFSFIVLKPELKKFFSIQLSPKHLTFLIQTCEKYKNLRYGSMPFEEKDFYAELASFGNFHIEMAYYPKLYITACANARYWTLFENTSVLDCFAYKDYGKTNWYKVDNNIINFLNGKLVTKIKNKTCPIALLPSFDSVVKQWK